MPPARECCPRGHPFSGENLYQAPGTPNQRRCLICHRNWRGLQREREAAREAAGCA